ncbi:MAG: hypothetical protein ABGY96_30530 [bacterium]|nr:hypothetical protein [Gammaproteobacteria bacterium]HIL96510.1 hypothetical protein [Pseudomonadales bacterium]
MKTIIPLVFFLLAVSSGAQEQTRVKKDPASEEIANGAPVPERKEPEDDKLAAEEDTVENTSNAAEPEAAKPVTPDTGDKVAETDLLPPGSLKNRNLSEAIEQFIPTETISADNAVPFPVDI